MEVIEELRRIGGLNPADLTTDDKRFIKEQAAAVGLQFSPRSACKSCYVDAAIVIYNKLKQAQPAPETTNEKPRLWVLKDGVDVTWRGIRINAATITDEKAEQYIRSGFPRKFFV